MSSTQQKTGKNETGHSFHVLIAAAGKSNRLGGYVPKQYQQVGGKAILRHTLEVFLSLHGLKSIRVIIDPEHANWYHDVVTGLSLPPPIHGGTERNISVYNGLKELSDLKDDEIILIHDAARPFVSGAEILEVVKAAHFHKAVSLSAPVADTMARANQDEIENYVSRDGLWALQTPQAFQKALIIQAHENEDKNIGITDDTSLVRALGHEVKIVRGSRRNFKITTAEDMEMAQSILNGQMQTRTGLGYDVHAFDFDTAGPVILCGVDVTHEYKLKGHSDADVGLHAITDALYGAMAEGDIGRHFPPSDDTFKNMDSAVFLKHASGLLQEKGGQIVNIDLTLICEAPKITPYAEKMTGRVAAILGIKPDQVSIKATTSEGLGFTGRREGIAAQAIASVRLPA